MATKTYVHDINIVGYQLLNPLYQNIVPARLAGTHEGIFTYILQSSTIGDLVYAIFEIPQNFPITRASKIKVVGYFDVDESTHDTTITCDIWYRGNTEHIDLTDAANMAGVNLVLTGAVDGHKITISPASDIAANQLAVGDTLIFRINQNNQAYTHAANFIVLDIFLEAQ